MPDDWEARESLDIKDPSDRFGIKEGELYDNLERYLNQLASDKAYLLPPVRLSAIRQNETEVVLNWTDITDDELGFVIQRTRGDGAFISIDAVESNVMEYMDSRADEDGNVVYRVLTISGLRRSVPSKPAIPVSKK